MRLRPPAAGLLALLAIASPILAACTSGSGPATPSSTQVVTSTVPAPTVTPTPLASGPTTASAATSCPYATVGFVYNTLGVRLGRVTVLRSGGQVVGCRYYAQQQPNDQCGATCLHNERLPGPNQPAVEVTTQRYASSTAAHNAFVLRAGSSASVTQADFGGTTGLCFQDDFDPQDHGADYACTVNKGAVTVLVRTVDTTQTTGAVAILRSVIGAVAE